jgi:ATP-dependent DNA helicase DinG
MMRAMIMQNPDSESMVRQLLSEQGPIAAALDRFESRPQQVDMACAVERAFWRSRHLVAEAGTGVGKSFAYLLPAIEHVCEQGGKALISTYTITLQEQLIQKDIPILEQCLSRDFTARLAKGRGNYLCKRRLTFALTRAERLLGAYAAELRMLAEWAAQTTDGSLSDCSFVPRSTIWDKVKSEHGNCRGRKCPHFRDCFYWRARRALETADIIVANHALLFSDLVLKKDGYALLPDYQAVILDEAHTVERVAEDHFGIDISYRRVKYVLDGLYSPRRRRGLLSGPKMNEMIDQVCDAHVQASSLFDQVHAWYQQNKGTGNGRCDKHLVEDCLSKHLATLRRSLGKYIKGTKDEDEKLEFARYVDMCKVLQQDLKDFLHQTHGDHVYWVDAESADLSGTRLKSAPINVGPYLSESLFEPFASVILTSATLSTGQEAQKDGFDFFAGRIGLKAKAFDAIKLGSPFDYERQVTIYIEQDLPNPNHPQFVERAAGAIRKYLTKTDGRAFVLFTSYRMLNQMVDELEDWLFSQHVTLLKQGGALDRSTLLRQFKEEGRHVLFGTDSFWQGVDVPGDALRNVMIVRLPFAVPDQPLLAGRLEQIREQGGNPFFDYQLPSAIIKFKQGFGRLVRTKTDTGIVVILDSRIIHKRYGQRFLASIPACHIEIVADHDMDSI